MSDQLRFQMAEMTPEQAAKLLRDLAEMTVLNSQKWEEAILVSHTRPNVGVAGVDQQGRIGARRVIWKYEVFVQDEFEVRLPLDANVLCVAVQGSTPFLWVERRPTEERMQWRRFRIVGTGREFDATGWRYVGTFQQPPFVGHVYEEAPTT